MSRRVVVGHCDADYLSLRGGVWQFQRRVPAAAAMHETRRVVRISTGTRDKTAAGVIASRINAGLEAYWHSLLGSDITTGAPQVDAARFEAAVRTAQRLGLSYRPAAELATAPLREIVERTEVLEKQPQPTAPVKAAVMGGIDKPVPRLSGLFEAYEKLVADRLVGKSEDQLRKWRAVRQRAVKHFMERMGDKPLADITRNEALDFRAWWIDRVRDEGYDQSSANKDIGSLAAMMRTLDEAWRLNLNLPFARLRVAGEKHNARVPYAAEFVRARILPGTELGTLNPEARAIVQLVAATGMRPSEIVGLTASRIVLEGEIPHVQITGEHRQLKTDHSERDMPLVGVALEVMRKFPSGFERYRHSPDGLSATVNKALGAAGLRPTPGHTLYSLRHTFKDRLIALEAPERVQDALMGHAIREIRYGAGPSLRQRAEWMAKIWG